MPIMIFQKGAFDVNIGTSRKTFYLDCDSHRHRYIFNVNQINPQPTSTYLTFFL
jgi:hypothetical protein